jgi:hypothetical protein
MESNDRSVNLGPLAAALAKAQTQFATVTRDKTVTVQTKTGGSYKFSYAPLDTILGAVRGPLSENGLALVQMLDDGALETTLIHESGASLTGRIALPNSSDIQGLGSAITYLRRYAIQAMLGIAAEEDDDGNHADGNTVSPRRPRANVNQTTPIRPVPATPPSRPSSTNAPEPDTAAVAALHGEASNGQSGDDPPWTYAEFREACKRIAGTKPDLRAVVTAGSKLFPTKGLELHEPKAWDLDDREWRQLAVVLGAPDR